MGDAPPRIEERFIGWNWSAGQLQRVPDPMLGEVIPPLPYAMKSASDLRTVQLAAIGHPTEEELKALKAKNAQLQRALLHLHQKLKKCTEERDAFCAEADRRRNICAAQTIFMHQEWTQHPSWTGMDALVHCQVFVRQCLLRPGTPGTPPLPAPLPKPEPEPRKRSRDASETSETPTLSAHEEGFEDAVFELLKFEEHTPTS